MTVFRLTLPKLPRGVLRAAPPALSVALALALSLGCRGPGGEPGESASAETETASAESVAKVHVVSTVAPLEWLVRRIGGDTVESRLLPPVGVAPEAFAPTPEQILEAAEAELIVANGAGLEGWMATATLPESRLVRTAEGLDLIETQGQTHSHGAGGEHSHAATDAYTFTDPGLLAQQGARVLEALSRIRPEESEGFAQRYGAVRADLESLASEYKAVLDRLGDAPVLATAGHFAYLARLGDVELRPVALGANARPSGHDLGHLRAALEDGAIVILWSEAPAEEVLDTLPEQLTVVVLDPVSLPSTGGEYDYLALARANLDELEAAIPSADHE